MAQTATQADSHSCLNRVSPGFSSQNSVITGEDPAEFLALLAGLIRKDDPSSTAEQILVEEMAHSQWISLRATRIQARLMATMTSFPDVARHLPLLRRYQRAAGRSFQSDKAGVLLIREFGFESKNAEEAPAAAKTHGKMIEMTATIASQS